MLRAALGSLLVVSCLIAISACATIASSSSAPPSFTDADRCAGNGSFWHANLGVCEKI